jgi:tetratricopeptide (TPR) repeat protein
LTAARIKKAKLLQKLGRHKEAIEEFDRVSDVGHASPILYSRRATSLLKVGDNKRALEDLNVAIRKLNLPAKKDEHVFVANLAGMKEPDYLNCWAQRMQAEIALGQQERALADATEILRVNPTTDVALDVRQSILQKRGKYADALRDLDVLIKMNRDVPDWYKDRAAVYQKLNMAAKANDDLAKAKHIEQFGK